MKIITILTALLTFAAAFTTRSQEPIPAPFVSPKVVDANGFPVQFSVALDALKTYYFEQVVRGSVSPSGSSVLESPAGKREIDAYGEDGFEVIKQLQSKEISFRIINPTNSDAMLNSWLGNEKQGLFYGSSSITPVWGEKAGPGWSLDLSQMKIQLYLYNSEDGLTLNLPPNIHQIGVFGRDAQGNVVGEPKYFHQSEKAGGFNLHPYDLPQNGTVILYSFGNQVKSKAYDIASGNESDQVTFTGLKPNITIDGMDLYTDESATDNGDLLIGATAKYYDSASPVIALKIAKSRVVRTLAVAMMEGDTRFEAAKAVSYRSKGQVSWTGPIQIAPSAGVARLELPPGMHFIRFHWDRAFKRYPVQQERGGPVAVEVH